MLVLYGKQRAWWQSFSPFLRGDAFSPIINCQLPLLTSRVPLSFLARLVELVFHTPHVLQRLASPWLLPAETSGPFAAVTMITHGAVMLPARKGGGVVIPFTPFSTVNKREKQGRLLSVPVQTLKAEHCPSHAVPLCLPALRHSSEGNQV